MVSLGDLLQTGSTKIVAAVQPNRFVVQSKAQHAFFLLRLVVGQPRPFIAMKAIGQEQAIESFLQDIVNDAMARRLVKDFCLFEAVEQVLYHFWLRFGRQEKPNNLLPTSVW